MATVMRYNNADGKPAHLVQEVGCEEHLVAELMHGPVGPKQVDTPALASHSARLKTCSHSIAAKWGRRRGGERDCDCIGGFEAVFWVRPAQLMIHVPRYNIKIAKALSRLQKHQVLMARF